MVALARRRGALAELRMASRTQAELNVGRQRRSVGDDSCQAGIQVAGTTARGAVTSRPHPQAAVGPVDSVHCIFTQCCEAARGAGSARAEARSPGRGPAAGHLTEYTASVRSDLY